MTTIKKLKKAQEKIIFKMLRSNKILIGAAGLPEAGLSLDFEVVDVRPILELVLLEKVKQLLGAGVRRQQLLLRLHALERLQDVRVRRRRRHDVIHHGRVQRAWGQRYYLNFWRLFTFSPKFIKKIKVTFIIVEQIFAKIFSNKKNYLIDLGTYL
jgi:hypothetical protein